MLEMLKKNAPQMFIAALSIGALILLHLRPDLKDLVTGIIGILGAVGLHLPKIDYSKPGGEP